jgi:hypothetical protein
MNNTTKWILGLGAMLLICGGLCAFTALAPAAFQGWQGLFVDTPAQQATQVVVQPPEPTPIIMTIEIPVEVVVTPTPQPQGAAGLDPRCPYTVSYGKAGGFKAEWDENLQTCIIAMHEDSRIEPGLTLADIVAQGLTYSFNMPFQGMINHSAEHVWVDGISCIPANPVRCNSKTIFLEGTEVKISTAAGNTSAGIFLIQVKP